jgi:hypothetical protein
MRVTFEVFYQFITTLRYIMAEDEECLNKHSQDGSMSEVDFELEGYTATIEANNAAILEIKGTLNSLEDSREILDQQHAKYTAKLEACQNLVDDATRSRNAISLGLPARVLSDEDAMKPDKTMKRPTKHVRGPSMENTRTPPKQVERLKELLQEDKTETLKEELDRELEGLKGEKESDGSHSSSESGDEEDDDEEDEDEEDEDEEDEDEEDDDEEDEDEEDEDMGDGEDDV